MAIPQKALISAVQSKLAIRVDGIAGNETWNAIAKALNVTVPSGDSLPPPPPGAFDKHTEERIESLAEPVRVLARMLLTLAAAQGIDARIVSGYRNYEEQAELYRKFKNGGPTAAPPGHSNHNFKLAFDTGIFIDGRYIDDFLPEHKVSEQYARLGVIGKTLGLIWGGDWHREDDPHFEFRPAWAAGLTEEAALAAYRDRLDKGQSLLA